MRLSLRHITWLKIAIWLAATLPLLWLVLSINLGGLSADPAKDIQHFTGRMALKLLWQPYWSRHWLATVNNRCYCAAAAY